MAFVLRYCCNMKRKKNDQRNVKLGKQTAGKDGEKMKPKKERNQFGQRCGNAARRWHIGIDLWVTWRLHAFCHFHHLAVTTAAWMLRSFLSVPTNFDLRTRHCRIQCDDWNESEAQQCCVWENISVQKLIWIPYLEKRREREMESWRALSFRMPLYSWRNAYVDLSLLPTDCLLCNAIKTIPNILYLTLDCFSSSSHTSIITLTVTRSTRKRYWKI